MWDLNTHYPNNGQQEKGKKITLPKLSVGFNRPTQLLQMEKNKISDELATY